MGGRGRRQIVSIRMEEGEEGGGRYGWQPMSGSRGRKEGGIHSAGEMPTDYADWGKETGGGRVNLAELRLLFDSGGGRRR